MAGHVAAGADAVLVSSAYAGGGLISTRHYREFVLPFEARVVSGFKARCPGTPVYTHTCGRIGDRLELLEETGTGGIDTLDPPPLGDVDLAEAKERVVSGFKARCPGTPVYTHTCGRIGDRLELLEETGTDGIDTLDPPPLGDVDLAEAKERVGSRLFLKGNVDPVGTVLRGTPDEVRADALRRIACGGRGGGYVLSTACSVPPAAPPANVRALRAAADAAA
jgi:uroporphyrinogen-III decarboxylase